MTATPIRHGRCLCGAVELTVTGPMREVVACHCKQCRQWTGYYWGATACPDDSLAVTKGENRIVWYRSSETARRAFCGACGSHLFWKMDGNSQISMSPGLFEDPTGFGIGRHIFCADKGDYYELPEDVERVARLS